MPSTAAQLYALGNDPQFRARLQALLVQQAAVVYAEAPAVPDTRRTFAKQVLANPGAIAQNVAAVIANRTNLVAGATTYDFNAGRIVTDVTDAALQGQIATDWNLLSGV